MGKAKKCTLIEKLTADGLFDSEREALPWVMERKVFIDNKPATSLKEKISAESEIIVKEYYKRSYAGKGGLKLEHAIETFALDMSGKVALDCGASTGGFTGCVLKNGASKVYAVDVGFGQLAGKLAQDERVVNMERTNLSDDVLLTLFPKPEVITLDLSYLSLRKAVPVCADILSGDGTIVCLVKPIYEIENAEIKRTGDMYEPEILVETLNSLCEFFSEANFGILGFTHSPVRGNNGAVEYFICLKCGDLSGVETINDSYRMHVSESVRASFELEKFKKT